MKKYKYHYFYKIENLINGKFYYGIHSTNDLNDKYMGSGRRLLRDYKIFGKENFVKTILKFFTNRQDASNYEASMVTENCVVDENCYNVKVGGDFGTTVGTILVKDGDSKYMRVLPNDERLKNGELVPVGCGMVPVFDLYEKKYKSIKKQEYDSNKERYFQVSKDTVIVKDKDGNATRVSITDERYLNGELVFVWCGRKHCEETKRKMSETHKRNGHQVGEKNSQYGTCWVTKNKENKKIKKEMLSNYESEGWKKGRYIK